MPNADGTMNSYEYYKMHKRCVDCRIQDAYTLAGRVKCAECAQKDREKYKNNPEFRKKRIQQIGKRERERKKEREAAGMCIHCGKNLADNGMKSCVICRKKQNAYTRNRRHSTYLPDGCDHCHKRPKFEEHRLCKECYGNAVNGLAKARLVLNNENHVWRDYWKGEKHE